MPACILGRLVPNSLPSPQGKDGQNKAVDSSDCVIRSHDIWNDPDSYLCPRVNILARLIYPEQPPYSREGQNKAMDSSDLVGSLIKSHSLVVTPYVLGATQAATWPTCYI